VGICLLFGGAIMVERGCLSNPTVVGGFEVPGVAVTGKDGS